jgi:hypothetical protein
MNLLQAGNDIAVIALWLGHEQVSTTSIYLHADMTQKERAIARTQPLSSSPAATAPPTASWPSSKACEYADTTQPLAPVTRKFTQNSA